jgi:hypothetical protein
VDLRLDHYFVLVEEVKLSLVGATWSLVSVIADDSFGDLAIILWVLLIEHHKEEIKTREQGVGQTDVLADWLITSVLSIDRVGCCDH